MNCRNFETHITELARGQMLEAGARETALAHLEECGRCKARFADEQALSAGLRAVAASFASDEAPARVAASLQAAFRQRAAPSQLIPTVQATGNRWTPWAIAAAAVLMVVSAFAALQFLSVGSTEPTQQAKQNGRSATSTSPGFMEESTVAETADEPSPEVLEAGRNSDGVTPFPRRETKQRTLVREARFGNARPNLANNARNVAGSNEEITTEFMPLIYGSNLSQLDDGQIVRVELPRSALQSLGLPVNAERAGERVKADVLLGHDGVAHAIRFVR